MVCCIAGCTNLVASRGLCRKHRDHGRERRCSIAGCDGIQLARTYCGTHYHRWRKHGEPGEAERRRKGQRPCRVADCANDAITRDDLCPTHRRRKRLYGNPDGTLSTTTPCAICGVPSIEGMRKIDRCEPHAWDRILDLHIAGEVAGVVDKGSGGYMHLSVRKKRRPVHRLMMERMLGRPMLASETVHHKNGDRIDNRPENLELWVVAQRPGQRLDDVLRHYVTHYRKEIEAMLAEI